MPITPHELVENLSDLPPLPQVTDRVLRLSAIPESTAEDFLRVIALDQALAGLTLRMANSAAFGLMRQVATLPQAIAILGLPTLKSAIIASSARNLQRRGAVNPQARLLWEHALAVAMASRAFAERLDSPAAEAFTAGLLHDLGKAVLGIKIPEHYTPLLRAVHEQEGACSDQELEAFGFDHTMVGEALAQRWHLPPGLGAAVRWHHEPRSAPADHRRLTAVVALANHLALELGAGLGAPAALEEASRQAMELLDLDPGALASLKAEVRQTVEREGSSLESF